MKLDELTIGEAKQLASLFSNAEKGLMNPFLGKRVLVRTYSAGVHIGTLVSSSGMECHLKDALRLWSWERGGLSLSVIATAGIKGGRLNRTQEVFLTNAIEFLPTTEEAEKSYERFIEE